MFQIKVIDMKDEKGLKSWKNKIKSLEKFSRKARVIKKNTSVWQSALWTAENLRRYSRAETLNNK